MELLIAIRLLLLLLSVLRLRKWPSNAAACMGADVCEELFLFNTGIS